MSDAFRNPSLTPAIRAADLVGRLSDRELLAQLGGWIMPYGTPPGTLRADGGADLTPKVDTALADGIGAISYVNMGLRPAAGVAWVNALQRRLVEGTRWGIPALFCEECAFGHIAYEATSMPAPSGLGATWDPALIERIYDGVARETRARGGTLAHTPVADLARDPRWGRSDESFSEDPVLTGALAASAVRGLQGGSGGPRATHLAATIKHFAGFAQSQGGRQCASVECGRTTLLNEILPPFREAVEAGVAAVMPAYPEIDGTPCHANRWLLTEVLRRDWGFTGLVTCDYGGVDKLMHGYHVVADLATAAETALRAGVDMDLPESRNYSLLLARMQNGEVRELVVAAVRRVLYLKFQLGLFERPYAEAAEAAAILGSPAQRSLAESAALAVPVLLQNHNQVLPLDARRHRRIALIGPHAEFKHLGDDRSGRVTIAEGFRAHLPPGVDVTIAQGCALTNLDHQQVTYLAETSGSGLTELQRQDVDPALAAILADARARELPLSAERAAIQAAADLARSCDVAVVCLGDSSHCLGENYTPARRCDRDDLGLPGNQLELLRSVKATGVPVVLVLLHGRAHALGAYLDQADAILDCWSLGEARGTAVARILWGLAEPRGRLNFTHPLTTGSIPCHYGQRPLGYAREYTFRDAKVAFPFGHGLTYTSFVLGPPAAPARLPAGESARVAVTVRNTGTRAGSCVVQVYLNDRVSSVTRPERFLVAWSRVELQAGEERLVEIEVPARRFAMHGSDGIERIEPGLFGIGVGLDSQTLVWTETDVVASAQQAGHGGA